MSEELKSVLVWVLSEGGAGVLAFWVMDRWSWVKTLGDEAKRWLAIVLTGVFALLGWGAQIGMLYRQAPTDWRNWIEQGIAILSAAFLASQIVHARVKQSRVAALRK